MIERIGCFMHVFRGGFLDGWGAGVVRVAEWDSLLERIGIEVAGGLTGGMLLCVLFTGDGVGAPQMCRWGYKWLVASWMGFIPLWFFYH